MTYRVWQPKRAKAGVAATTLCLAATVLGGCSAGASAPRATSTTSTTKSNAHAPFRIALITSLTGPYAVLGKANVEALDIAVQQVNAAGGVDGHKIVVITKDDETVASQAAVDFDSVLSANIQAVVGGPNNTSDEAMAPLAAEHHIPLIALTITGNLVNPPRPYYYEVVPVARSWGLVLLQYLKAKKITRIGFLYDTTNLMATEEKAVIAADAAKYGIKIVDYEQCTINTTDFSTNITHLMSSGAQAVEVWSGGPPFVTFTKQAVAAGLEKKMKIVMPGAAASYLYWQPAGTSANGVLMDANDADLGSYLPASAPFTKMAEKLIVPFKKKYGVQPPQFGVDAYAGVQILAAALKQAGTLSSVAINKALSHLKVSTVDGNYSFSRTNHGGVTDLNNIAMARVEHGELIPTNWELSRLADLPK